MRALLIVAVLLFAYALVSRRLSSTPLTAPMIFVALGVLLGPDGTDTINGTAAVEGFRLVLEAALALVLFTDAASLSDFSRAEDRVPFRLLSLGLPLSIAFGWLTAKLVFPSMPLWEAALLGAILAPTDAALGAAVISNRRVPRLIRDALNVESGLNDGLALPFVTIFMALAAEELHTGDMSVVQVIVRSLVLSPLLGVAIGGIGALALRRATTSGWATAGWAQVAVVAIAFAAYSATVSAEGSGFIGAWVAGFIAGKIGARSIGDHTELADEVGSLLGTIAFLAFGVLFVGPSVSHLGWSTVGYAVLSLTVVRSIPVAVSLAGTGLRRETVAYIAWFGPRGLASIVFLLLAIESGVRTEAFVVAVTVTVLASIYLHGASALAGSARYATWFAGAVEADPSIPEAAAGVGRVLRHRVRSAGAIEP
jgi:sodium/hydrogen antiporter